MATINVNAQGATRFSSYVGLRDKMLNQKTAFVAELIGGPKDPNFISTPEFQAIESALPTIFNNNKGTNNLVDNQRELNGVANELAVHMKNVMGGEVNVSAIIQALKLTANSIANVFAPRLLQNGNESNNPSKVTLATLASNVATLQVSGEDWQITPNGQATLDLSDLEDGYQGKLEGGQLVIHHKDENGNVRVLSESFKRNGADPWNSNGETIETYLQKGNTITFAAVKPEFANDPNAGQDRNKYDYFQVSLGADGKVAVKSVTAQETANLTDAQVEEMDFNAQFSPDANNNDPAGQGSLSLTASRTKTVADPTPNPGPKLLGKADVISALGSRPGQVANYAFEETAGPKPGTYVIKVTPSVVNGSGEPFTIAIQSDQELQQFKDILDSIDNPQNPGAFRMYPGGLIAKDSGSPINPGSQTFYTSYSQFRWPA